MDRAELIAKSWENEFKWSHSINTAHGQLRTIARRVLAAVKNAEPTDAALNTAVLICCGVEEEDRIKGDGTIDLDKDTFQVPLATKSPERDA